MHKNIKILNYKVKVTISVSQKLLGMQRSRRIQPIMKTKQTIEIDPEDTYDRISR